MVVASDPGLKHEGRWRPGLSSEFVTGPPKEGTAPLHHINHVRRIQMPALPRAPVRFFSLVLSSTPGTPPPHLPHPSGSPAKLVNGVLRVALGAHAA